jgi:hypothetical protein
MAKSPKHSEVTSECLIKDLGLSDNRRCIGQKRNVSGPLDGHSQHTLVLGAIPGNPARGNFAPFRGEIPENFYVFIINGEATVRTELAHFSSVVSLSESALGSVCAAGLVKGSIISHLFHPRLPCLLLLNLPLLRLLQLRLFQLELIQQVRLRLDLALASVFQDQHYHSV